MLHNTLNSAYFLSLPGIHPMTQGDLHWGVARSSRARFFVCFIAPTVHERRITRSV